MPGEPPFGPRAFAFGGGPRPRVLPLAGHHPPGEGPLALALRGLLRCLGQLLFLPEFILSLGLALALLWLGVRALEAGRRRSANGPRTLLLALALLWLAAGSPGPWPWPKS